MKLNKQAVRIGGAALILSLAITPAILSAKGMGMNGDMKGGQRRIPTQIQNLPIEEINDNEKKGLLLMREEEKLARDVYKVLYDKWQLKIFANIGAAEQRHMDAIKTLLDRYQLEDPIAQLEPGSFANKHMATLYNQLTAKGRLSQAEALQVGATIEDLDIKDLNDLLKETDNSDIQTIYQNLVKGSRNHLRAFTYQLSGQNIQYKAQYLTQKEVDGIVTSPQERGRVDATGNQIRFSNRINREKGNKKGFRKNQKNRNRGYDGKKGKGKNRGFGHHRNQNNQGNCDRMKHSSVNTHSQFSTDGGNRDDNGNGNGKGTGNCLKS